MLHLVIYAVCAENVKDEFRRCSQLSPRSLGIGQHCLATCEGVCNQRVAIPGTILMRVDDVGPIRSDCGNGKQRYMCISTPATPHGYPLCTLLDPDYYKDPSAACWTECLQRKCPEGMVPKDSHRTNFGCFDSNSRVLCVP
ncbi:hypothetical protein, conserved [Babesia bigemina]|uniref:Uncharacterized protein n=1 Tax=Babesia bigemina TaxID=5866 RepID=A0A061DCA1_BABBI|nr:hypothetical protein, conserved [Babesia bigemina]CDR96594.1 hypothetical protein, conserved [Babesia bigemina]|eukprot:XP_012768780.1 hypothetical protein, conserved [Babesia bigemina]